MEKFREPWRVKIAHGGRGAGAKSWSAASLLIQRAHVEALRICCFREVQKSLEESSYRLMVDTITRLCYSGWVIRKESLESPAGAHIIFRGLVDLRAADQMKSLEGYDIFWLEEASAISKESIDVLLPTLRKEGSELWATLNRDSERDPIMAAFWDSERDDVLRVELLPGKADNPWFPPVLQKEMEEAYRSNPDEAEHVWGGAPRKQGDRCVLSRVAVRAAMTRSVEETEPEEIGVDIARFGDDRSEAYRRRGGQVVAHKEWVKTDLATLAGEVWDFADRNPLIPIKVDVGGLGAGVADILRKLGAYVVEINFGGAPQDAKKYTTVADELWFEFPVEEAGLPDDPRLMEELTGRRYDYDKLGRRKIEPKDEFKKRFGRSPDKADGLLLAFYSGYHRGRVSEEVRRQMKARRQKPREE